jgi:hypothetical protein
MDKVQAYPIVVTHQCQILSFRQSLQKKTFVLVIGLVRYDTITIYKRNNPHFHSPKYDLWQMPLLMMACYPKVEPRRNDHLA